MMPTITRADEFEINDPAGGFVHDSVLQSGSRLEHRVPAWHKNAVARLLSGRFILREVPPNTTAIIAATHGRQLIRVSLPDDQIVATKVKRVVGLFGGTTFAGGRISPSVTAISLDQIIMHVLRGPGDVYFESASRSARVLTENSVGETSFDPRSIVCFGAGTEFVVTSGRDFLSLAVGTWQLELKSGWVVFDKSIGTGGKSGLGSVLKRVYLPWL